jgi:hypothetical protein
MIAVGAVSANALASGVFATPMSFADESETSTKHKTKQKKVGTGESTNFSCGQNFFNREEAAIEVNLYRIIAVVVVGGADGARAFGLSNKKTLAFNQAINQ